MKSEKQIKEKLRGLHKQYEETQRKQIEGPIDNILHKQYGLSRDITMLDWVLENDVS